MTEKYDGDDLLLSSGLGIYANERIIGINDQGRVSGGYDQGVDTDQMTDADRRELAEIVIARWKKFGGVA